MLGIVLFLAIMIAWLIYAIENKDSVDGECCNGDCNQGRDCPNRK